MWFLLYCEELNYWNEKGVAESTIIAEVKTFVTNSKANPGKCMQIAYSKTVVTTMQCANHYNIFIDWFSNWCRSSKYVTKGSQDIINIKTTFSAAVTTEATLSLLKFCNPEIICKGHKYGAN